MNVKFVFKTRGNFSKYYFLRPNEGCFFTTNNNYNKVNSTGLSAYKHHKIVCPFKSCTADAHEEEKDISMRIKKSEEIKKLDCIFFQIQIIKPNVACDAGAAGKIFFQKI